MLSKEEIVIEQLKQLVEKARDLREEEFYSIFTIHEVQNIATTLKVIQKQQNKIKQLESNNQKLIEKLETDIEIARREYRITLSDRQDGIRQEAQEILKIVKGEKK